MPLLRGHNVEWTDRDLFFQFHRGLIPQRYQNCAVRSQRWKALSRAGDELQHDPKDLPLKPEFRLYDMVKDPGETTDLAKQYPELVNKMKLAYDVWYEEMWQARHWAVGVIHIGSENEPVTHLCVYQDSCYDMNKPTGWSVEIERSGHYRITINRANYPPGKLMIKLNSSMSSVPLENGENSKIVKLPAGKGKLSIWVEQIAPTMGPWSTSNIGDCDLEFLRA